MRISELEVGEVYAIQPWGNIYDIDALPGYISSVTNAELLKIDRLGGKPQLTFKILADHKLPNIHWHRAGAWAPGNLITISSLRRVLGSWERFVKGYETARLERENKVQAMRDLRERGENVGERLFAGRAQVRVSNSASDPYSSTLYISGLSIELLPLLEDLAAQADLERPALAPVDVDEVVESLEASTESGGPLIDLLLGS